MSSVQKVDRPPEFGACPSQHCWLNDLAAVAVEARPYLPAGMPSPQKILPSNITSISSWGVTNLSFTSSIFITDSWFFLGLAPTYFELLLP